MLGPIDLLAPFIEYIVLALIIVNLATRHLQHRSHKQAASAGVESLSRHPAHVASNVLLVLGTFYFLSVDYHGGMILGILILSLVITDFFEFESRAVELRMGDSLEPPKAAIVISGIALLYAAYVALFFVIEPAWRVIF